MGGLYHYFGRRGGNLQQLGHHPLLVLLWSALELSWRLWVSFSLCKCNTMASKVVLVVKNYPAKAGKVRDLSLIPGSRRSPGRGHGNPLQCFCMKNPMDRG